MCGKCCSAYWVPVTHRDVARISASTGLGPREFVDCVPKGRAGEWGVPSFLLEGGEYYLVLRQEPGGSCVFLRCGGGRCACSVHGAKPLPCRMYPLLYVPGDPPELLLIPGADQCPGVGRGAPREPREELLAGQMRIKELREYAAIVRRWNRMVRSGLAEPSLDRYLEFTMSAGGR
jgi:Fe-S-cluster containining protein